MKRNKVIIVLAILMLLFQTGSKINFPQAKTTDNPNIVPVKTGCDFDKLAEAEGQFIQLSIEIKSHENKEEASLIILRDAAMAYIRESESCYDQLKAENNTNSGLVEDGGIYIDNGGLWAPGTLSDNYVLVGTKWGNDPSFNAATPPGTAGGTVSYSFMGNGVNLADEDNPTYGNNIAITSLPTYQACFLTDIRTAFTVWSAVANIQFVEVNDNGQPSGSASAAGDIRIGAHIFDGASNTLAHAYFPFAGWTGAGDMHFDIAENWTCNASGIDIGLVAIHEIGHAIGLKHEPSITAIMNPFYNSSITSLQTDDINGVTTIYGSSAPQFPTYISPTNHGSIADNTPTFTWSAVGGTYEYQLLVDNNSNFSNPEINTTSSLTSYTPGTALEQGTYYWKIRGRSSPSSNWGSWGSVWDTYINITEGLVCNTNSITIPNLGQASTYPSTILFSTTANSIVDINVQLVGLTHTFPDDLDLLLVGPSGQNLILMSDVGIDYSLNSVNLTLDDEAGQSLPDIAQIVSGSYKPTNINGNGVVDTFPAPAPAPSVSTTLTTFDNTNPNGQWSLYIYDDVSGDLGALANGWCLDIQSKNNGFNPISMWTTDFDYVTQGWRVEQHPRVMGDVNGDGKDDIIGFGYDAVFVGLANASGTGFLPLQLWSYDYSYIAQGWRVDQHPRMVGDVNGDGKADLVGFGGGGVWVALSTGSNFAPISLWTTDFGSVTQGWRVDQHPRVLGDVNGDGKDDVIGFGYDAVFVGLANAAGNGFLPIQLWSYDYSYIAQGWRVDQHPRMVGDVNGDGKADLVGFGGGGVWIALSTGSNFAPITLWTTDFGALTQGWRVDMHPRVMGDVNGDGRDDVIGYGYDAVWVGLANASGNGFLPLQLWSYDYSYVAQGWRVNQHPRMVGDVNGDGKNDLIGFGYSGVWVGTAR